MLDLIWPCNEFSAYTSPAIMLKMHLSIFDAMFTCSKHYNSLTGKGWSTSGCSHATSVCAGQPTAQEGAHHQQEEALCPHIYTSKSSFLMNSWYKVDWVYGTSSIMTIDWSWMEQKCSFDYWLFSLFPPGDPVVPALGYCRVVWGDVSSGAVSDWPP